MTAILRDASGKMHHGILFDPLDFRVSSEQYLVYLLIRMRVGIGQFFGS